MRNLLPACKNLGMRHITARGHRIAVVAGTPGTSPSAILLHPGTVVLHGASSDGVAIGYSS